MKTISLLGCGNLGFPLALKLIKKGYCIKGSTKTPSKIKRFQNAGIIAYLINLDEAISLDFFDSDVLVLTLPYKKT